MRLSLKSWQVSMVLLAVIGAGLSIADGTLTPATSSMSSTPRAAPDSQICRDVNEQGESAISACTRIIQGKATGHALADAYYTRGQKHSFNGNMDQAIADFSTAIEIEPNWSWPYSARGHVYARKRDFTRAFEDQAAAIRLAPTAVTYLGRASDLLAAGSLDQAIVDLGEAVRLDPKYFYAFLTRGDAYFRKRDFEKASDDYRKAVEIGSRDRQAMERAREGLMRTQNRTAR